MGNAVDWDAVKAAHKGEYQDPTTGLWIKEPVMLKKPKGKKGSTTRLSRGQTAPEKQGGITSWIKNIISDGTPEENRRAKENVRRYSGSGEVKRYVDAAAKVKADRKSTVAQRKAADEVLKKAFTMRRDNPSLRAKPSPAAEARTKKANKAKKDADALKRWNEAIAKNEADRLAAEKATDDQYNQNNGGGGGSGVPQSHSNWDVIGQQALGRMNPIYDSLEQRNALLNSQRATTSTDQQTQFAAETAQRYAQMQQAMGAGYQDAMTRASGDLQLQALQNAGMQQDQYSKRMQEMNTMNALDNTNAIAQARAAQSTNIQGAVIDARAAEAAANAEAAARAAASRSSGGGALSRSEYGYAKSMAEADAVSQYTDWVASQGFNSKTQPRLAAQLAALRGNGEVGAAPDSLLAGLGSTGQSGQRGFLTTASRIYNQRRNLNNDQIMAYADAARQGTGSYYK